MFKNKLNLSIIFISFFLSLLYSEYNLKNFDKNIVTADRAYHQMIKSDPYRYLNDGYGITKELREGTPFLKTGPENYTKYLPARIAAIYYYIFNYELFEDKEEKIIKSSIHNFYLYIQCFFYFISVFFFSYSLRKKINNDLVVNSAIIFLCIEPTIFQYHGSFWSESYFFSFQLLLLTFILRSESWINLFFVGIFLGILSLQKQLAFFYVIPIILYYLYYLNNYKIKKIFSFLLGFFLVLCILGFNNLGRTGKFHILPGDTRLDLHLDLVEKVMMKKNKISKQQFRINEGEAMSKWIDNNNIEIKLPKEKLNKKYTYWEYRHSIINEKDKGLFDKEISKRTVYYFAEYPIDFLQFISKSAIHTILLNPFHIYSDNKYESGEFYYATKEHDELVNLRIVYTFIIYSFCLIGLCNLYRTKNYKLLSLCLLSIIYFYSLVSWHGNTRYFMPNLIYLSLFFGYSVPLIKSFFWKKVYFKK
jgi:hypothetical protein